MSLQQVQNVTPALFHNATTYKTSSLQLTAFHYQLPQNSIRDTGIFLWNVLVLCCYTWWVNALNHGSQSACMTQPLNTLTTACNDLPGLAEILAFNWAARTEKHIMRSILWSGQQYSVACGFSRCTTEFAVCRGICCLPQKNAELPVFCYIYV